MKKYKAKILPNELKAEVGAVVPLITNHEIYGPRVGSVEIVDPNFGIITTDKGLNLGQKLSAGAFVKSGGVHEIREVSLVKYPRYEDCEILEVIADD